jgi:RNA polymerase sigma-70 factor (ECF subfamily)
MSKPKPITPGTPRETAIPQLLDTEGAKLFSLAGRFCGSKSEAEDMVQEVFLQAWRSWDKFEGRSAPGTWLYTIAARTCQRMHRKKSGEPNKMEALDELLPLGSSRMALLPSPDQGPLEFQLHKEQIEHIEGAIAALPKDFRMPLVLKEVVGLSVQALGQVLELPLSTVKTRLHRARLKLRLAMDTVLPQTEGVPPSYSREVCLDLLAAKQKCLDEGLPFQFPDQMVCERCESVFGTMDLAQAACEEIGQGILPEGLQGHILGRLAGS